MATGLFLLILGGLVFVGALLEWLELRADRDESAAAHRRLMREIGRQR